MARHVGLERNCPVGQRTRLPQLYLSSSSARGTQMTGDTAALVSFQLRLDRPPSMRMIANSRLFIQELCDPVVGVDASSRVAMVVHELLENLTKYADSGPVRVDVEVQLHQNHHLVRITSANLASPEQLAELELILKDIATAPDPRGMYLNYITNSVERREGSRLGLARIRAEGEMDIRYSLAGNEITIYAEAFLDSGSV